jgi:hypothetical protein
MFVFIVFRKHFHPLEIYQNIKCYGPTLNGKFCIRPQNFDRPPFWNGCSYSMKDYGIEVTFNGMSSLLNFRKSTSWFRT